MAQTVCMLLDATDAARLAAIASDRSRPLKHTQRARIVLLSIHAILDNVATNKHPKVHAWLARHPRWTFHFTPTSASSHDTAEGFISALTRRRLRRGSFSGIVDLQAAIKRYIAEHNRRARPFVRTKSATDILAAVSRSPVPSV